MTNATLVGHSMAGGEIARYFARHGGKHIARTVFVAPTTPYALKTADNPEGTDRRVFDQLAAALAADSKAYLAAGAPGLLGKDAAPETVKWALDMAYQADPRGAREMPAQLQRNRLPVRPARAPGADTGRLRLRRSAVDGEQRAAHRAAIAGSRVEVYEGAPHGLFITDRERFDDDLLRFIRS